MCTWVFMALLGTCRLAPVMPQYCAPLPMLTTPRALSWHRLPQRLRSGGSPSHRAGQPALQLPASGRGRRQVSLVEDPVSARGQHHMQGRRGDYPSVAAPRKREVVTFTPGTTRGYQEQCPGRLILYSCSFTCCSCAFDTETCL